MRSRQTYLHPYRVLIVSAAALRESPRVFKHRYCCCRFRRDAASDSSVDKLGRFPLGRQRESIQRGYRLVAA